MKYRTEIFENCTLQQACEWIAYKIPPMEEIRARGLGFKRHKLLHQDFELPTMFSDTILRFTTQDDKDYSKQIYDAADKLKLAIYDGAITAFGNITIPINRPQKLDLTTGMPESVDESATQETKNVQITNIPNTFELDIGQNKIQINNTTYTDIYIPFQDLKRVFHNTHAETAFNAIESRYSTPYIEIMVEVINELKITYANQPQIKVIKNLILQKLNERAIWTQKGKPSDSLASRLATAVRLLESQKGHA